MHAEKDRPLTPKTLRLEREARTWTVTVQCNEWSNSKSVPHAVGSGGKKRLYLAEGEKVTLEFSPEGETKFYQIFQEEETGCAKAQRQGKAFPVQGIIPRFYYWSRKCEESGGRKAEGVLWAKHSEDPRTPD